MNIDPRELDEQREHLLQRAQQGIRQPALNDDADIGVLAVVVFIQAMPDDVITRCRQTFIDLAFFMSEGGWWVRETFIVKACGFRQRGQRRHRSKAR